MPYAAHVKWPVYWALVCLARISEVQAQSLSVYIDNVLYTNGSTLSCRPGATLLFQCEYLSVDQSLASPFPPRLCSLTSGNCRQLSPTSSPSQPFPSGKLRTNYTISGVASGTQSFGCQYTSPVLLSMAAITFTDSSVNYPPGSNCAAGSPTAATSTASSPTITTIATTSTATTRPTTATGSKATTSTGPTSSRPTSPQSATIRTSSSPPRSTSPATDALTDLNPLIYTVVGVFLLGVLAIVIIITCWIRARRMFNSRMVNLRTTASPFDYLDYINDGDLTPMTTTEFIISMQQQRPPTYNQSQELEVLSSDGNPPPLPARNGTRSTEPGQVQASSPSNAAPPLTRHPDDDVSPEEAEAIESRINVVNRRLVRASRGRGHSRHTSGTQTSDTTALLTSERDASPPDLFEGQPPSQSEGTQMSLLL